MSCADISPSSSHFRLERLEGLIETCGLVNHNKGLSLDVAFDTNESYLKELEIPSRTGLSRAKHVERNQPQGASVVLYFLLGLSWCCPLEI